MPYKFCDDVERHASATGNGFEPIFKSKVQRDGVIKLEQDGERNVYEEIQSHKDSCSIELALARASLGDDSLLHRTQGAFGDFTTFPKTFAEVLQVMINAESYFDGLPAEIRNNFGNDFNRFLAQLDSPDLPGKLGMEVTKDVEVVQGVSGSAAAASSVGSADLPVQPMNGGEG